MHFHIVKMYQDKVNKNVKHILLLMCDIKVFLTFTFVVKILQVTWGCWWRWFTIDVPPFSLNLILLWQLLSILFHYCYTYCYSDSRNLWAVMKAGGWRFKIWSNPPFLYKCLYQVRVITVFTVYRLLTDFVCLYTYEFWLSLWKIVRSSVMLLLPLFSELQVEQIDHVIVC
jgi:hypothetical protein